jgi:hypothetical protein
MHLNCCPDGCIAKPIGGMFDEPHAPFHKIPS